MIPARSAVEFVHKECVDRRVQLEITLVLISSKVQLGTMSCKECVGQLSLRIAILSRVSKDCCCRSAQSRVPSTLRRC
jgi:hypothetical protein